MTAADVMDSSAVLLNDSKKSVYTYDTQLPFLKIAYSEAAKFYQENNVPCTNALSSVVEITTSMTDIGGSTGPALPTDLVEIQSVWERDFGATEDFTRMTKCDFLPQIVELSSELIWWTWQNQIIKFLGALSNRDVQIQYIANSFSPIVNETTTINIINLDNMLAFRTAGLCARFIGENPTRADELDKDAGIAIEVVLNLATKGRQVGPVRRRPFMATYRSLGRA